MARVFFDGTGNEPSDAGEFKKDQSVSNVLKLHVLTGGDFGKPSDDARELNFYYNEDGSPGV